MLAREGHARGADDHRSLGRRLLVKRLLDVTVAGAVLVVASPVLGLSGLLILLEDGRPVLFRQQRAGRNGRRFEVFKLRTMRVHDAAADRGQVALDHPLVTRTGRVLRRLKIDELPQLVAVLSGTMSLVGPRPALVEDAERYDEYQRRRLRMRPGLTGWAQVNGNTALTWPERILLDVWYVEHWSLLLDLRILWKTLGVLVRGERLVLRALEAATAHATGSRRSG